MLRRHPIALAYLFALVAWGALALQLRAEPVAGAVANRGNVEVTAPAADR
jgi:hypothetical protein